jgi:hypothetical protein
VALLDHTDLVGAELRLAVAAKLTLKVEVEVSVPSVEQELLDLIYKEKLMSKVVMGRMELMVLVLVLWVELESIESLGTPNTAAVVLLNHTD